MSTLLARKDVRSSYGIHPTTLWRWEQDGLQFLHGRISDEQLAWWLEQAEAARRLGCRVLDFLKLPRKKREKLLKTALLSRRAAA